MLYTDHIRFVNRRRWFGFYPPVQGRWAGSLCLIQAARIRPGPETKRVTPPSALPTTSRRWSGARAKGFDFLAYLLAMALKESRRLSGEW